MNIVEFSWVTALLGGVLIGLSAVVMMASIGKIAGISGILGSALRPASAMSWQLAFIGGLVCSGVAVHWLYQPIPLQVVSNPMLLILAGLLVGFGTRMGSGCTSGHGVCGISRLSLRSLVATCVFIGVGMLTVLLMGVLL